MFASTRLASLVALVALTGSGCRGEPFDAEQEDASAGSVAPSQHAESIATVERCGPGFEGQMIRGARILQEETDQTAECTDADCYDRALGMMRGLHLRIWSCDNVRYQIKVRPIMDAWGSQARVI